MLKMKMIFCSVCLLISQLSFALEPSLSLQQKLQQSFDAGDLVGLHSVMVVHQGEVIVESYFAGEDQRWGSPLGDVSHGPDTLHDLRSVTKSIVGLLYGIALAQGKVPAVDTSLLANFPQYPDLAADSQRQNIQIEHALSMRMGTQWNETLPYYDSNNSEIAMERASDRYRFILDRPMQVAKINSLEDAFNPSWNYNGGATAVIAKIISDGTGMSIDAYAKKMLFEPLGITDYEWVRGADGVPAAASGLRMRLSDLAKVGQLINQNGQFNGRQIIDPHWLVASFTPRANLNNIKLRYGYFWWLSGWGSPPSWVAGFGHGGQRLTVQPKHDLTIVIFAGNYFQQRDWELPVKVIEEFVVPAVKARLAQAAEQ